MMQPLNTPLETGIRLLCVLSAAHPTALGISELVLLDHALLHSADLGGPPSLHPPLPSRVSELGIKRTTLELGIQVLLRTDLARLRGAPDGLRYEAGEGAGQFLSVMEAGYVRKLQERARWVVDTFGGLDDTALRIEMRTIFESWSEEFDVLEAGVN